jgi:hypothetical protein
MSVKGIAHEGGNDEVGHEADSPEGDVDDLGPLEDGKPGSPYSTIGTWSASE